MEGRHQASCVRTPGGTPEGNRGGNNGHLWGGWRQLAEVFIGKEWTDQMFFCFQAGHVHVVFFACLIYHITYITYPVWTTLDTSFLAWLNSPACSLALGSLPSSNLAFCRKRTSPKWFTNGPRYTHDGSVCMQYMVCHWPSTKTPVLLAYIYIYHTYGS